jgi:c-di-GMP-binding flagellar brake protein YcgR
MSDYINTHKQQEDEPLHIVLAESGKMQKEEIKNIEDYMPVNTRISVGIKNASYQGIYDSRVEDVDSDNLYISQPSAEGVPVPMVPGTIAIIEFVSNNGRFRFETKVTGRKSQGRISLVVIEKPKTLVRNQLREFYRVDTRIKGKVKLFYAAVPDKNMKIPHKSFDCMIMDVSGGGGKLITSSWMENNQPFLLDMSEAIPELDSAPCTAVRVKRIQERSEISFRFDFKKESERNLIIKYVFKRQIELKQTFE